jgi:NAD(P)-dependent dehydrogenase (short-subunit alcohol dehydrogenase family)
VARGLRERGYRVLATARSAEDVARLCAAGFEGLSLELREPASIIALADEVLRRTRGELYGLFNNAGSGVPGAVEDLSAEALRDQLETNLLGPHELTRRLLPAMRRRRAGRIVQNGSALALVALPLRGAYIASKYALEGLTDTLRLELHGSGIHVSLIEPGPTTSGFRARAHGAFLRHVERERSPHREAYRVLEQHLASAEHRAPFTATPAPILRCVLHALESPRPRIRYYPGAPSRGFAVLRRLLPARALDALARAIGRRELAHPQASACRPAAPR